MGKILKIELNKALHSKYFMITITIAIVIALWSSVNSIQYYYHTQQQLSIWANNKNPKYASDTLFNHWMGGEFGFFPTNLYYFTLPLIASFPYGWSYFQERSNGYEKNMVCRCGRKNYILSKYISTFVVGGLTVIIPLLLNFIIIACVVPARMPDPCSNTNYAVFGNSMWSTLFYSNPFLYDICYLVLTFVFSGLWATVSILASFYSRNRFSVLLIPYILLIIFHYGIHSLFAWTIYIEASPINYLRAVMVENKSVAWLVFLELFILFVFSFGVTVYRGLRDDVC